jgi:two-component system NtrC family response regulator
MSRPHTVLVADDDETICRTIEYHLGQAGYRTTVTLDGGEALLKAEEERPDILITDVRLPGIDGIELVSRVHSLDPRCMIIVITAYGSIETAVDAMKRGAFDFLTKPLSRDDILRVVERAAQVHKLVDENIHLRSLALERYHFDKLVTASPTMRKLIETAARVAQTESTVLIMGESGTGKELLARAIHFASPRSDGPFYAVNIGAIPETLADSALFGHRKGAFTGAVESRAGAFEEAEGGTLLLDEVGELKPEGQVKLLRVLQEREFSRLGESQKRTANVRVIAATNRDLEKDMKEGRFREDLYYRLCVVPLSIPPLRERREDIPLLVQHFVSETLAHSGGDQVSVSPDALKILTECDWPGNVRQLENVVERMIALNDQGMIDTPDVPVELQSRRTTLAGVSMTIPEDGLDLEEVEKALIQRALDKCDHNQTRTAEFLRITRNTLLYRMDKYGLAKKR